MQAPREGMETADPYVKVYLLPDLQKTTKQKTKIAKRTLNPTYNQQVSWNLFRKFIAKENDVFPTDM